jgi:hypothetical protein
MIQGNLQVELIDSRVKLLNKFCNKLLKFHDIFNSQEMKIFFNSNTDIIKSLEAINKPTYEELVLKYKNSFIDFYKDYDEISGKKKISEFLLFLKRAVTQIKVNNFNLRRLKKSYHL